MDSKSHKPASLCHEIGKQTDKPFNQTIISRIYSGKTIPDLLTLIKIAQVLGVTLDDLICDNSQQAETKPKK